MKTFKSITALTIAFLSMMGCRAQVKSINAEEFAAAVAAKARIVDVRTSAEYLDGHIAGAVNVDWNEAGFLGAVEKQFDKSKPLYIYCRSGRRSAAAARTLSKAGYVVYDLAGGILAWTGKGFPVVKDEN